MTRAAKRATAQGHDGATAGATGTGRRATAGSHPGTGRGPQAASGPLDVDAIAARAQAAPGGYWLTGTADGGMWIPWSAPDDREPAYGWDHGRFISEIPGEDWYGPSGGHVPAAMWEFITHAREDVLALAAEVRQLRAQLASRAPGPDPAHGHGRATGQRASGPTGPQPAAPVAPGGPQGKDRQEGHRTEPEPVGELSGDTPYAAACAALDTFAAAARRNQQAAETLEAGLTMHGFDRDAKLMSHVRAIAEETFIAYSRASTARLHLDQQHAHGASYHARADSADATAFRTP